MNQRLEGRQLETATDVKLLVFALPRTKRVECRCLCFELSLSRTATAALFGYA